MPHIILWWDCKEETKQKSLSKNLSSCIFTGTTDEAAGKQQLTESNRKREEVIRVFKEAFQKQAGAAPWQCCLLNVRSIDCLPRVEAWPASKTLAV